MLKVSGSVDLSVIECARCGVVFAITERLETSLRESKDTFYCPNGHRQYFPGKTDADRAKELERRLEQERTRNRGLLDQVQASERSKASIKGHLTRIKNRIANGVCPVCNRHFDDLHQHMEGQHPGFGHE